MNKTLIIQEVISKVESGISLGSVQEKISETSVILNSNFSYIDNIIVYYNTNKEIIEVSLYGEEFSFSIEDLTTDLSAHYKYNYNFRDNFTLFTFGDDQGKRYFTSLLDDKVKLLEDEILIIEPSGNITAYKKEKKIFNHISIKFNLSNTAKVKDSKFEVCT